MTDIVIKVENLSKQYCLGVIGGKTLSQDLNRWWHLVRDKEDPYLGVTQSNERAIRGGSKFVWALKDISFEVRRGEVLGIIGANGAGKSTLLKVLSRLTTPTTGKVSSKGSIASLLEVGTGFHPELTGLENIFLNGAIMGMTKTEVAEKLDEIIDFSGCARYIDTPVKRYSSGMRVRLGFAVAAHLEPEILIVDEVLAVGDIEFQKKSLGKMRDATRSGRTVLFVSHNMPSIRSLCHSCMLLRDGRIVYRGDTNEAIQLYVDQWKEDRETAPIAERTRDHGVPVSLEAKIVGFKIVSEGQENPSVVDSSKPFTAEFKIETEYESFRCGTQFIISDDTQNLVMCDSASMHGTIYTLQKGTNVVRCEVGPTYLFAGSYRISCVLSLPNQGLVDYVPDAYAFAVGELDPNNTGFGLERRRDFAVYYVDHRWGEREHEE